MKRLLFSCLALACVAATRDAAAQSHDDWRSSPQPHAETPGGEKNDRDKKKEDDKKPAPDGTTKPERGRSSAGPSLSGIGLPLGIGGFPGGAAANGGGGAAGGGIGGGGIAGGAAGGGIGGGGIAGGVAGAAAGGGVAAATHGGPAVFGTLPLKADGAAVIGPSGSVALAQPLASMVEPSSQPNLTSAAEASELAKQGLALFESGNVSLACQLFERAARTQRTAVNLAHVSRCYASTGHRASAWLGYRVVAAGDDAAQAKDATDALAKIGDSLPKLTFDIKPSGATPTVLFDGRPVPAEFWGKALPVDPGSHEITVQASGHPAWSQQLVVTNGNHGDVVTWPSLAVPREAIAEEKPWYISGRVLMSGTVTLVMGASAAVLTALTLAARADYHAQNGQAGSSATDLNALYDTARTRGVVTTGAFAVTALGFGLTGLFVALDSGKTQPERPKDAALRPVLGGWANGEGGGLTLRSKL